MFVKCASCGYLTSDAAALCKQCGAVVGARIESEPEPQPPVRVAWPPASMPPPTLGTAAPAGDITPPAPPAPPPSAPAMFPEPGARPPRRSLPPWSFVTGALVVVVALVIGGIVATSGHDSGARSLRAADAHASRVEADVAALDAALLDRADFGSDWTVVDHRGLPPDQLVFADSCADLPGLRSRATLGRTVELARNLQPDGADFGHFRMHLRLYASADDAEAQLAARADPSFQHCIAQWDAEVTGCVCVGATVNATHVQVLPAPPGTQATVYLDAVDYTDHGQASTFYFLSAYSVHGRTVATVDLNQNGTPIDPVRINELLTNASQRLALHVPA